MNTFLEIGSSSSLVIFMNLFCAVAQALNCLALPIGWFLLRCYPQSISQTPVQLNSRAMSTCHGMLEWFSLKNAFFFFMSQLHYPVPHPPPSRLCQAWLNVFSLAYRALLIIAESATLADCTSPPCLIDQQASVFLLVTMDLLYPYTMSFDYNGISLYHWQFVVVFFSLFYTTYIMCLKPLL